MSDRYEFGSNWANFIEKNYTPQRRESAKRNLLDFVGMPDLKGLTFLDIGSGSGLHSLAAFDAGAARIHSFDYDPMSVQTTQRLWELAGKPPHWTVERGDILDRAYVDGLGQWKIVYSWGVLHHTGSMWEAVDNAAGLTKPDGSLFIALYSSNVARPSPEFWLDVKKRYNRADAAGKRRLEWWYLWRFGIGRNPLRLPLLLRDMYRKRQSRGMDYMTDVRDWLGGWPMEYADDQDVVDRLESKSGYKLVRVSTGEACSEFLFEKGRPAKDRTLVRELVAKGGDIRQ